MARYKGEDDRKFINEVLRKAEIIDYAIEFNDESIQTAVSEILTGNIDKKCFARLLENKDEDEANEILSLKSELMSGNVAKNYSTQMSKTKLMKIIIGGIASFGIGIAIGAIAKFGLSSKSLIPALVLLKAPIDWMMIHAISKRGELVNSRRASTALEYLKLRSQEIKKSLTHQERSL